jgi:tyrosinase
MSNGLTTRLSTDSLESNPAALTALRDATAKMQALAGTDNRSWIYWAGIHGFPQFQCWHHGRVGMGQTRPFNLFLPWHRAYVLHVEHALRDQNAAAAIPWWDWSSPQSSQSGVSRSYADRTANGQANPLFSGPVPEMPPNRARQTARFPLSPQRLPRPTAVEAVLRLTSFNDFQRQLEDLHDFIHGWTGGTSPRNPRVGGDMGAVATAAFDPIFWAHHAMIDRLWYLWQLRHGVQTIPPDYLRRPLAPFPMTVEEVLDINLLGYEYAETVIPVNVPNQ